MNVFVAGGSGAIGQPLVRELIRRGHRVTAMAHSATSAAVLAAMGAGVARVDAFDEPGVEHTLRASGIEVVIDELTALPQAPSLLAAAAANDRKLRLEGGGNVRRAALRACVRRYIQQSSAFFLAPGSGLADETEYFAIDASPGVAASAKTYADLEARVLDSQGGMEGVAARYGFFYGPRTWYWTDGAAAEEARRGKMPVVGRGEGVWSFVHVEDAALATVQLLTAPGGIYNIVDDDASQVCRWLPAFARAPASGTAKLA